MFSESRPNKYYTSKFQYPLKFALFGKGLMSLSAFESTIKHHNWLWLELTGRAGSLITDKNTPWIIFRCAVFSLPLFYLHRSHGRYFLHAKYFVGRYTTATPNREWKYEWRIIPESSFTHSPKLDSECLMRTTTQELAAFSAASPYRHFSSISSPSKDTTPRFYLERVRRLNIVRRKNLIIVWWIVVE